MRRDFAALPMQLTWLLFAAVAAVCWWLTGGMALDFDAAAPAAAYWQAASFAPLFAMWAVMMAAMMMPSFIPTARCYARLLAAAPAQSAPAARTPAAKSAAAVAPLSAAPPAKSAASAIAAPPLFAATAPLSAAAVAPSFTAPAKSAPPATKSPPIRLSALVAGYLLLWLAFSAGAALLQQVAAAAGGLSDSLAFESPAMRALLLAAAGAFQFSALKMKCLRGCRHPAFFFLMHWRGGAGGAFRMGMHNGLLCLGCCVWLMLLLFAGGVMSLPLIALLTLYVAAEKMLPLPPRLMARAAGCALLAAAALQFI